MIYFLFTYTYNGKSRTFRVDADSKLDAISKGFDKVCADEHIHRCELSNWDCYMVRYYGKEV